MKSLILVTSPPACGKTYVSKSIAKRLDHVVYLDKDTLIVLSKQIFKVANQEYNRSSDFFEENIRDYEYYAVLDLAFEALEYEDNVFRDTLKNNLCSEHGIKIYYFSRLRRKYKYYLYHNKKKMLKDIKNER